MNISDRVNELSVRFQREHGTSPLDLWLGPDVCKELEEYMNHPLYCDFLSPLVRLSAQNSGHYIFRGHVIHLMEENGIRVGNTIKE